MHIDDKIDKLLLENTIRIYIPNDAKDRVGTEVTLDLLEATAQIKSLIKEIAEDIIGESEQPPIGEMGKFDAQTRTFELDTDTEAVKYHIQRVANQNNLRQSQREKLKGLLK